MIARLIEGDRRAEEEVIVLPRSAKLSHDDILRKTKGRPIEGRDFCIEFAYENGTFTFGRRVEDDRDPLIAALHTKFEMVSLIDSGGVMGSDFITLIDPTSVIESYGALGSLKVGLITLANQRIEKVTLPVAILSEEVKTALQHTRQNLSQPWPASLLGE